MLKQLTPKSRSENKKEEAGTSHIVWSAFLELLFCSAHLCLSWFQTQCPYIRVQTHPVRRFGGDTVEDSVGSMCSSPIMLEIPQADLTATASTEHPSFSVKFYFLSLHLGLLDSFSHVRDIASFDLHTTPTVQRSLRLAGECPPQNGSVNMSNKRRMG